MVTRILVTFLSAGFSASLFAFVANENIESGGHKVVLRPQLQMASETITSASVHSVSGDAAEGVIIRRDQLSGAARLITIIPVDGFKPPHKSGLGDYVRDMRHYVGASHELLGVSWRELRRLPEATLINSDLAFFKYHVFRDDIRIEDAALLFRFKHDTLVQVLNNSFAEAEPLSTVLLSDGELREILRRELGKNDYVARGWTWRVTTHIECL